MSGVVVTPDVLGEVRGDNNPRFERRVNIEKGQVAFVELKSPDPLTVYIMYPTQYTKYNTTGSLEGVLELKNITWLLYPLPAMLEDQTVYFVPEREVRREVTFNVEYEDIKERIDRLLKGEERLRAGMEMMVENGVNAIRLTPLIPGLKIKLDFSGEARFVIVKTIDFARFRKGIKTFEQLYGESDIKGSQNVFNLSTTDFEDLYLLVEAPATIRVKSIIHATKESAESGC